MSAADANARLALAVSTIAFGYFLKRVGLVDVDVGKAMLKVLFNATLPAMLLMTFASLTFDATSVAVSLCAMAQAAVLLVTHLAFKGTGRDPKDTALLAGSCVGVNLGTFAYPLVEAVWGTAGVTRLVLFDAVNQWSLLIVAPLIYASVIAGPSFSLVQALGNVKKQLLSPCLLAMFAAVALRVFGLGLPGPAVAFTSSLAVANKPLALLALAALGAFGARRGGAVAGKRRDAPGTSEDAEDAFEAVDVTVESTERDGSGGGALRAIARSSRVSRVSRTRPVPGAGFGSPAAPRKCVSPRVAAAPPRASAGLPGRSGTREGCHAGGCHEPSRRVSAIAGSRARAVVGARFG